MKKTLIFLLLTVALISFPFNVLADDDIGNVNIEENEFDENNPGTTEDEFEVDEEDKQSVGDDNTNENMPVDEFDDIEKQDDNKILTLIFLALGIVLITGIIFYRAILKRR